MNAIPPKITKPLPLLPANAAFAGVLLAATAAGIAAVVYFFNPSTHSFYPVCQFHRLTGLNCPGCGATRAIYALLHGQVLTALRDNALLVLGLPVGVARGLWLAAWKRPDRAAEFFPARYVGVLLILALIFTVLRNLPCFSFLSPAA